LSWHRSRGNAAALAAYLLINVADLKKKENIKATTQQSTRSDTVMALTIAQRSERGLQLCCSVIVG